MTMFDEAILRDENGVANRKIVGGKVIDLNGVYIQDYRDGAIYKLGTDECVSYIKPTDVFPPPLIP